MLVSPLSIGPSRTLGGTVEGVVSIKPQRVFLCATVTACLQLGESISNPHNRENSLLSNTTYLTNRDKSRELTFWMHRISAAARRNMLH